MELRYSSQARAAQIVALARVVFAASFVVSLRFANEPHGFFDRRGFAVVAAYALFSLLALVIAFRRPGGRHWAMGVQALDVAFFSLNLLVSDPSPSPRFISFIFPLFAACVIFSWRAGVLTSLWLASVYAAGVIVAWQHAGGEALLAGHFLYRSIGYIVISALVIYARAQQEAVEGEIAALSAWPLGFAERIPTRDLLDRVSDATGARRLVMIWEEPDEPWLHVASKIGADFRWVREAPTRYEPPVHPELEEASFMTRNASSGRARVVVRRGPSLEDWQGRAVNEDLSRDFDMRHAVSLHLAGSTFTGRLFILDRRYLTPDHLLFGELVARLVVSRLDQYYLTNRTRDAAVGAERLRLSRDLHDGVLQSLTGVSLQIEAVRNQLARDPTSASDRLGDVQAVLAADQRELRAFIRQLRPAASSEPEWRLAERLSELSSRFSRQWGITVDIRIDGLTHLVTQAFQQELYSIVSEAVANAAKHANATVVTVSISSTPRFVHLHVKDNGHGFPFEGTYDLPALNELRRGPVTLKERIAYLRGELTVESSPQGAAIDIRIPYERMGA